MTSLTLFQLKFEFTLINMTSIKIKFKMEQVVINKMFIAFSHYNLKPALTATPT